MDLKNLIKKEAEKALLKKATDKILPMDSDAPKLGWKAKLAGILATVAAIAAAASEFLGS